jgi:hypothetical protein
MPLVPAVVMYDSWTGEAAQSVLGMLTYITTADWQRKCFMTGLLEMPASHTADAQA